MKIRLGELRSLVRERLDPKVHAHQLVQATVDAAEGFVDSIVAGSPDKRSAADLRAHAEEITSFAKWLLSHRERNAEPVAMVAKYANDLADLSDFWKRPAFLGKEEYAGKVKDILKRMQRKQVEALS